MTTSEKYIWKMQTTWAKPPHHYINSQIFKWYWSSRKEEQREANHSTTLRTFWMLLIILFFLILYQVLKKTSDTAAPKLLVSAMRGCLNTRLLSQITHMYGWRARWRSAHCLCIRWIYPLRFLWSVTNYVRKTNYSEEQQNLQELCGALWIKKSFQIFKMQN